MADIFKTLSAERKDAGGMAANAARWSSPAADLSALVGRTDEMIGRRLKEAAAKIADGLSERRRELDVLFKRAPLLNYCAFPPCSCGVIRRDYALKHNY